MSETELSFPHVHSSIFESSFLLSDISHSFILSSLPLKTDRPQCADNNTTTEKFQIDSQSSYATGQHVIDDGYELEDEILCDNMDDDESNHSYVFLQQQQHYTPPPVEFQEGATPQHQTLIKKGSIMRNNPELMKRNRQNNSLVDKTCLVELDFLILFLFTAATSCLKISWTSRLNCLSGNMEVWGRARPPFAYNAPSDTTRWSKSLHRSQQWPRPIKEYRTDVACSRLSALGNSMLRAETKRDKKFVPCKFSLGTIN